MGSPGGSGHASSDRCARRTTSRLRAQPGVLTLAPGAGHWPIFTRLVREAGARGNLVPDAFLAAIALESNATFVTTDRDYARFDGLRCMHPLT